MSGIKCTQCQQAAFRDGLCIDHFRAAGKGGASRLVAAATDEKIDDALRNKFRNISKQQYVPQAQWYLNAYWSEGGEGQAEDVWNVAQKFMELDPKKKNGNELDPVLSSHYLQGIDKAMTALELKEALRRIDVDANGQMALIEYLLFKYKRSVVACVNNPQGSFDEEAKKQLDEAQRRCEELAKALEDLQAQLLKEKEAEAKVKVAEKEARDAEREQQRLVDELKAQIDALDRKTKDTSIGQVARNKAVQELAQLRGQDPLPLRRAKITSEATVRRLEAARKAQIEQTKRVEAAVKDTERKSEEAQALVEELKKKASAPHGTLWWMSRQVTETKKYLPRSRQ